VPSGATWLCHRLAALRAGLPGSSASTPSLARQQRTLSLERRQAVGRTNVKVRNLKAVGVDMLPGSAGHADLTPHEVAVTSLVAQRLSDREAATELAALRR
jgi:hypothetical protein